MQSVSQNVGSFLDFEFKLKKLKGWKIEKNGFRLLLIVLYALPKVCQNFQIWLISNCLNCKIVKIDTIFELVIQKSLIPGTKLFFGSGLSQKKIFEIRHGDLTEVCLSFFIAL